MCMGGGGGIYWLHLICLCLSCFVQVYLGEGVGEVVTWGGRGVGEGGGKGCERRKV